MTRSYISGSRFFAFNIWDYNSIKAVMDAAKACGSNVILQTSSRIFEQMEQEMVRRFVSYYRDKTGVNAYLHLDHCRKLETLQRAVDQGWDSVMLDASHLSLADNIALTNQASEYAHARGVLLEAEVGQINGVEDGIENESELIARMSDIEQFLRSTDVDMFAAAIGTCHGLYKKRPQIHYDMIERIGELSDKPFVIHGGSGLTDNDFVRLLSYKNVKKINISTELKQAYRRGIKKAEEAGLLERDGFEAIAVEKMVYEEIKTVAEHKMGFLVRI